MSSLNRLFGLAAKALDSPGSSSSSRDGSRDWRSMMRDVAGAVTGEARRTPPAAPHPSGAPSGASQPDAAATPTAPGVGLTPPAAAGGSGAPGAPTTAAPGAPTPADRAAIARYEYLLQTSDPHQVEVIHREAFARLTPQQRAQVQVGMRSELRPSEHPPTAEAPDLARAAARTEAVRPGTMAGLLARVGRGGRGASAGGLGRSAALVGAGGLLGAVAGAAVVTTVAAPLLAEAVGMGVDFDAIAGSLDLDAIAGGVDLGGAEDLVAGAGEQLAGAGDAVTGLGEQLSGFEVPGLRDLFG